MCGKVIIKGHNMNKYTKDLKGALFALDYVQSDMNKYIESCQVACVIRRRLIKSSVGLTQMCNKCVTGYNIKLIKRLLK